MEEIDQSKAEQAYAALGVPLIVDDTDLFISALSGFPGPYAASVQDTIGNDGILRLMSCVPDRSAYFATAVAYADADGISVFSGRVSGTIAEAAWGTDWFGYDPIFYVGSRPLAEITIAEKSQFFPSRACPVGVS